MKPRNKFEKAVFAQSGKLPSISKAQSKWAFQECINHYAYRLPKGRTTCMDCGHSWTMDENKENCTCPECGAKLKVSLTYCRKLQQKQYFTIMTTSGSYQVLRMFLLVAEMEKGCKAQSYALEIGQYWWNEYGRKTVVAIQRVLGHYIDTFSFCSPMAIRGDNQAYRHIAYAPIYPKFKAVDMLERNGFNGDFHGIVPTTLIPALLTDPKAETLIKAGQYPMLSHYLQSSFDIKRYWASAKICIRNGYIIEDGSIWHDYIDLLRHFGKDTNSPKYVCPTDLKAEHDRLVAMRDRQREKQDRERERRWEIERQESERRKLEQIQENERLYAAMKSRFFDLVFLDGVLRIQVLQSVQEFYEEGKIMKHCVFTNDYYLKPDSLVFSARIGKKHIETIEISLKTFEVVQSRGVCNSNTEYHDRIINLVNKNTRLIRKRMRMKAA